MSNSLHLERPAMRTLIAPTLFEQLDEALRDGLLAAAPIKHFTGGQLIQQRGEDARGFWVIQKGTVRIGIYGLKGDFRAIALLASGDSYGELAVFAGNQRAVDAVADGPVAAYWIDAGDFDRAILGNPEAMRRLIGVLSEQLQEMLALIASLSNGSAVTRIAATLAALAVSANHEQQDTCNVLTLGQQELGELTGLTRATVNTSLKRLEQEGAIKRGYGRIEICDLALIRRAALS